MTPELYFDPAILHYLSYKLAIFSISIYMLFLCLLQCIKHWIINKPLVSMSQTGVNLSKIFCQNLLVSHDCQTLV